MPPRICAATVPDIARLQAEAEKVVRETQAARVELADLRRTQDQIAVDLNRETKRNSWNRFFLGVIVILALYNYSTSQRADDASRRAKAATARLEQVIESQAKSDEAARQRDCQSRNETRAKASIVWAGQQAFNAILLGSVVDPAKLPPDRRAVYDAMVAQQDKQEANIATTYAQVDCTKI